MYTLYKYLTGGYWNCTLFPSDIRRKVSQLSTVLSQQRIPIHKRMYLPSEQYPFTENHNRINVYVTCADLFPMYRQIPYDKQTTKS